MAEVIRVGSWNMLNAFGDESRSGAAVETVKRMDADVLFLGETALLQDKESPALEESATELRDQLGYAVSTVSDYYPAPDPRPNQHLMSIWSRVHGTTVDRWPVGNRYALSVHLHDTLVSIIGYHPDDRDEATREASATALLNVLKSDGRIDDYSDKVATPTVLMGDFNTAGHIGYLGLMNGLLRHVPVKHYQQDPSKLQRIVSKAQRTAGMGSGRSLAILERAGFVDADPMHRPTIGGGSIKLQLDRIMGAGGARLINFQHHKSSRDISDHTAITASMQF